MLWLMPCLDCGSTDCGSTVWASTVWPCSHRPPELSTAQLSCEYELRRRHWLASTAVNRLFSGADDAASKAPEVQVQRSARRKKTVSAHWSGGTVVLQVPARMSAREVTRWQRELVPKLVAKRDRARSAQAHKSTDTHLQDRALELSRRHLGGAAQPTSITWSARQNTRWGSATPATGAIRISNRLQSAPAWVLDAVIFHELCHLLEANHGPAFRNLEQRGPRMAEAQAFLDGAAWASGEPDGSGLDNHQF